MLERYAAHLRFHYRILKSEWDKLKYTDSDILEMWYEYIFVKEELGEIKTENNG